MLGVCWIASDCGAAEGQDGNVYMTVGLYWQAANLTLHRAACQCPFSWKRDQSGSNNWSMSTPHPGQRLLYGLFCSLCPLLFPLISPLLPNSAPQQSEGVNLPNKSGYALSICSDRSSEASQGLSQHTCYWQYSLSWYTRPDGYGCWTVTRARAPVAATVSSPDESSPTWSAPHQRPSLEET